MSLPGTDHQAAGRRAGPAAGRGPEEKRGPGMSLLLLLLPVACCGGPFIIAALAAAGAATLGVAGGIVGAIVVAVAVGLWIRHWRRAAACCPPQATGWRR